MTTELLLFLRGQLGKQGVINDRAVLQRRQIVGTHQPNSLANEVQARRGRLDLDLLHSVRLVDDAGNPVQDWIGELVLAQDSMKRTVSLVVRQPHAGNIERLGSLGQRLSAFRNKQEFGL